jgi:acylphosphatase
MPPDENVRLHATVEGHVQGVGFRYFVLDQAQYLGLTGWVRNTFDGEVEVVAEGSHEDLEKLQDQLWKGPASAYVSKVNSEWEAATGEYRRFGMLQTY